MCCTNHALQETPDQSKVTIQASFTPIHPKDPRLAQQNQLPNNRLSLLPNSYEKFLICLILCWNIILHYCSWLVVIFTQTCHHYLSIGIATTGPSNRPHKHCQSNYHGNKKEKKETYRCWLSQCHCGCPMPSQTPIRNLVFVVGQGLQRWGCPPVFYNRSDRTLRHRQNDSGKASWQRTGKAEVHLSIIQIMHFYVKPKLKRGTVLTRDGGKKEGEERGRQLWV